MNKRARLARRILRDHRNPDAWHTFHMSRIEQRGLPLWRYWTCTHCPSGSMKWTPHAYR